MHSPTDIQLKFQQTRNQTEKICAPLEVEDHVPQPIVEVSPPKWHLAHSTWFFEQFVLIPYAANYVVYSQDYAFLFNSYYNHAGDRVLRPDRGAMSRPPLSDVLAYRAYVTKQIIHLLEQEGLEEEILDRIVLGINHEEQHQELLVYDIKYILGTQPTFPIYGDGFEIHVEENQGFVEIEAGMYEVGYAGNEFCYDNEKKRHRVFLEPYAISKSLVTNADYLAFMTDGGYETFDHWLDEGWQYIQSNNLKSPLYWHHREGAWWNYTFAGIQKVDPDLPVQHISFYEAMAYASWKGTRLPTEFEWEVAASRFKWGNLWEWTNSAYLPYPGFEKASGALGEYNGKFMINQMVLRGASRATPSGHSRPTYRNFFPAHSRWIFSGIRLAK